MELAQVQRPKGQPLLVFATVVGGWLVLRVLLWEPPFGPAAPARSIEHGSSGLATMTRTIRVPANTAVPAPRHGGALVSAKHLAIRSPAFPPSSARLPEVALRDVPGSAASLTRRTPRAAEMLERAASATTPNAGHPRWSGDAWLFLRNGSAAPLLAGRPSYGRSQAGAVLRYRFGPPSGHRPNIYVRSTRTITGTREREVAAGVAARPLPDLPLSLAAEVRVYDHASGRETRAAAFAVTELPPTGLPLGLQGELYLQAGYVGGKFATAFADGQLRVDRQLGRGDARAELRLGGAISGGVQDQAGRLDVGPSATVSFPVGEAQSRLALDYRFRVAGDAEPGDGPALTFSAGF